LPGDERTGTIACVPRFLILAVALVLLVPSRADAKVTCSSGKTLYTHARTRVFTLYQRTEFYACSAAMRRPRLFAYGNDGSLDDLYGWKPYGHRLSFIREWVGGDNLGWAAGWVDLRTGLSAEVSIQPDHGIPFAVTGQAVVVAPDGSVAILQQVENSPAQVIAYARFGKRKFHEPHLLATVDAGDVDAKSLAITAGSVTWTTTSGVPGSVPIG
jgi:hypothetical protein